MSKAATTAPPRSAPPGKEKAVRNRSRVSGNAKRAAPGSSKSLRAKEEEYRKMNAELEAKTAELVKEAEHLVKGNLSLLCDLESSVDHTTSPVRSSTVPLESSPTLSSNSTSAPPPHPPASQKMAVVVEKKKTKSPKTTGKSLPASVPMTTDSAAANLNEVVVRMERNLDGVEWTGDTGSLGVGLLPETADDMGPEALTRFLKAKLRVMQEEIDRLCQELTSKVLSEKQLTERETAVKELADENIKLRRTQRTLQPELEKQRAVAEGLRQKCGGLETQLATLRKEVDVMKGGEKKARSQQSAIEVRLNRALEEVERQKSEIANLRAHSQDSSRAERSKVEELVSENKQLLRQRNELMTAFKKQLRLIDLLKRQKMHMEAATLLSFTEEEFVKALDWQAT